MTPALVTMAEALGLDCNGVVESWGGVEAHYEFTDLCAISPAYRASFRIPTSANDCALAVATRDLRRRFFDAL